jgi:hypothetical protein
MVPDRHAPVGAARLGITEAALREWLDEMLRDVLDELAGPERERKAG